MNILVRNLSRVTTESELKDVFAPFGEISSCNIVMDERTKKSKGFGFVEMKDNKQAVRAVKALNGMMLGGCKIRVKPTKRRT
jgi:RNA recognition motif-containing protein